MCLYVGSEPFGDELEPEHEEAYLRLEDPYYLTVYEAPMKDDDMPIYIHYGTLGLNT